MAGRDRYQVKEIFGPTLQGEGLHQGWPCLFLRLAGCNAWDGRPETREGSACPYCDTDFRGGEPLTLEDILARLDLLRAGRDHLGLVLTGGEPLLQADSPLLTSLAARFPWVDLETNGTRACPDKPSNLFISCSPKVIPGQEIVAAPDWWKILIPAQEGFLDRALASGQPVFVQPVCPDAGPTGATYRTALARCLTLCHEHGCRLSLQMHKIVGIP